MTARKFPMTARKFPSASAFFWAAALGVVLFLAAHEARAQDHVPIVTTPAQAQATEGVLFTFIATATDPDGDPIEGMSASPLPEGATFTPSAAKTSGTFEWTPGFDQAGSYNIQITAVSACRAVTISDVTHTICLTGGASTRIDVTHSDGPPVVIVPVGIVGNEASPLSFLVAAGDPDGSAITSFTAAPLPDGARFTPQSDNTEGLFEWTPAYGQAGTHIVTFTAANAISVSAEGLITISPGPDRRPIVTSPAAVSGSEGALTTFTASAGDPDGEAIEKFTATPLPAGATFVVNDTKTAGTFEWTPDFTQSGTYSVILSAESACRPTGVSGEVTCVSGTATTTITIGNVLTALAFTTSANRVIRLGSGKASWCAHLEPVNDAYDNADVVLESLSLSYGGASITAITGMASVGGDRNGNGVQELVACFAKDDLRTLFGGLPRGSSTVEVALEADLVTGGRVRAVLTVTVSSPGGLLATSISPNPMNPDAVLTFVTSRSGWARVSLFDIQGRLMRRVLDEAALNPGIHDIRVDGSRKDGRRLPSGVYFYRVETAEGAALGRLVIAK